MIGSILVGINKVNHEFITRSKIFQLFFSFWQISLSHDGITMNREAYTLGFDGNGNPGNHGMHSIIHVNGFKSFNFPFLFAYFAPLVLDL